VAQALRRKPARGLGLALGGAERDSMSEAGLLAAKPGYQWRPGKLCSERKRGARSMGPAGGRRLGPATRVRSWWTARDKGPGPLELNLGCRGRNERATGGARESARRARVRLRTLARANSSGHRATLRAVKLAAAGGAAPTASPPKVEDAGNGYSASSWTATRGTSGVGSGGSVGQVAAVGKVRA
jgi:hypothetical protein